jgi:hypothetical protein
MASPLALFELFASAAALAVYSQIEPDDDDDDEEDDEDE